MDDRKGLAHALATDALNRDPLQPAALRVLAESLDGQRANAPKAANALMMQANRLSRRDVATQMWLIDHYGRSGDAERMVRHLDIVMRASESARPTVFPMLALAASDRNGQELIVKTLSAEPNWAKHFVIYVVESGPDLAFADRAAQLLLDATNPDDRVYYLVLLKRLTEDGRYSQAWELYGKRGLADANAREQTVRHGDFEGQEDGSPFDWTFAQEPELWAARERIDGRSGLVLSIAAHNGRSGEVAWQILHLSPGSHTIRLRMGDVPTDRYERPEFRIECAGRSSPLVSLVSANPGTGSAELSASFTVPQDCSFQRAIIRAAGDGPLRVPPPWIDDIRID